MDVAGFSWTAGARKHRITRTQVRLISHAGLVFARAAEPPERPDEGLLFVGDDEHGNAIEVVAVELDDSRVRVSHAMAMRDGYRGLYGEAKRWRQ